MTWESSQIADEFVGELLGGNYLYITAVHLDKEHMHVHIIFDSVSCVDGLKYNSPKYDWEKRIQPITDCLCRKYNLSTLQYDKNGERKSSKYDEWQHGKKEKKSGEPYSPYDIVRDDIDEAINRSSGYREFLHCLKEMKYEITRDQKYLSLKPHWRERAIRSGRLGDGYTKEEIQQRIAAKSLSMKTEQEYVRYGKLPEINQTLQIKIQGRRYWKLSPMQKKFYQRLFRIYHIRRPSFRDQSWRYKEDILQVKRISGCFMSMLKYDIETPEDVTAKTAEFTKAKEALELKEKALRTRLYRSDLYHLLKDYDKAEQNSQERYDPEQETKRLAILTKIEAICPLPQARTQIEERKSELTEVRAQLKYYKNELRTMENITELHLQYQLEIQEPKKEKRR